MSHKIESIDVIYRCKLHYIVLYTQQAVAAPQSSLLSLCYGTARQKN